MNKRLQKEDKKQEGDSLWNTIVALQLSLQWSGITTCIIDIEKMIAFFDGYLTEYDNCFRAYSGVYLGRMARV